MSLDPFTTGDFVELVGAHDERGKRGYVVVPSSSPSSGNPDLLFYSVAIDEYFDEQDDETWCKTRQVAVRASDLKLLWKQGETKYLNVFEYMNETFPVHGIAAASFRTYDSFNQKVLLSDTPHGRLERPPISALPGPHSIDMANFPDAETKELYTSLYKGQCKVWCKCHFAQFAHYSASTACPILQLGMCKPGNPELLDCAEESAAVCTLFLDSDQRINFKPTRSPTLPFLSVHQVQSLCVKAAHYFLRLAGTDFGFRSQRLLDGAMRIYQSNGWWKEQLDAAIVFADMVIMEGGNNYNEVTAADHHVRECMSDLGRALMTCREPFLAGEICRQTASSYIQKNVPDRITLSLQAAKGFGFAGAMDESEEMLFAAVGKLCAYFGNGVLLREPLFQDAATCMSEHCILRAYGPKDSNSNGDDEEASATASWTTCRVASYLYTVAYGIAFGIDVNDGNVQYDSNYLLQKYHSMHTARKAIRDAFQQAVKRPSHVESWKVFESAVCSWANKSRNLVGEQMQFDHNSLLAMVDGNKIARKNMKARQLESATLSVRCGHPNCPKALPSMRYCSKCNAVPYCSRDCQIADWPAHRSHCKSDLKARQAASASTAVAGL